MNGLRHRMKMNEDNCRCFEIYDKISNFGVAVGDTVPRPKGGSCSVAAARIAKGEQLGHCQNGCLSKFF